MPFLATIPTPMIAPRKETMFSDVPVSQSATTVPNSASTAPKTIAIGFAERTELDAAAR